jgi:acetyltransferase-like isoleucine patch superfamily enzyme
MNYAQPVEILEDGTCVIPFDWYNGILPSNMKAEELVYFDTSYSFTSFNSKQPGALQLGFATGNYGRSNIISGRNGIIKIGRFVILEATNIICNNSITIGDHCMFSWGSVVTDSWLDDSLFSQDVRKAMLEAAASSGNRHLEYEKTKPVIIGDNVWVGFDAVILPGVTLGNGCVIGCKTVISEDVPPYAVVAGEPAKVIRYLEPTDTVEAKQKALQQYLKKKRLLQRDNNVNISK